MKQTLIFSFFIIFGFLAKAQEFNTQLTTAKTAYSAGKLDDSRFAMQQMLHEIDMVIGKEVLKLFPAKIDDKSANAANDNVSGASGFLGVVIRRDYGPQDKNIEVQVISNSPAIAGINAILSLPLIGNSGDNKVVKIGGYKALIQKSAGEKENTFNYELQIPLHSSLLTITAPGYTQDQVIKIANLLPVDKIAKMLE